MRASGILLPVTSLPSLYGIGCFSKEAYEFVDQLEKAGKNTGRFCRWDRQVMGIPRTSLSPYAGNPYFIDLETLVKEGLLTKKSVTAWTSEATRRMWIMRRFIWEDSVFWKKHSTDSYRIRNMKLS